MELISNPLPGQNCLCMYNAMNLLTLIFVIIIIALVFEKNVMVNCAKTLVVKISKHYSNKHVY